MALLLAAGTVRDALINYALLQQKAAEVGNMAGDVTETYQAILDVSTQIDQNATISEEARIASVAAAALLTSNYEDRGDWNPSSNTPTLTANPSAFKTGEKWPRYAIPVGGNLPFAIKGRAINTPIPAGYLVGHPLENVWYWMPESSTGGGSTRNNPNFVLGPQDNIKIEPGATSVKVKVTTAMTVHDEVSGYRFLGVQEVTVQNNVVLVLSSTPPNEVYSDPRLWEKGSGQSLYLYPIFMLTQGATPAGYAPVGLVTQFKWTPHLPAFADKSVLESMLINIAGNASKITSLEAANAISVQFRKNRTLAIMGGPDKVVVTKQATTTTIQSLPGFVVIDGLTGYRGVHPSSIVLNNFDLLILSKNPYPGTYADPELHIKGQGGTIHLFKVPFNTQALELPGIFIIGAVLDNKWVSNQEAFRDNSTPIDANVFYPNMADPEAFTHGKAIGTNGVIVDSSGLFLTDYIEVTPGKPYYFRTLTQGARNVVAFNSAKQPIGGINTTWTFSYTPPPGTKYLRVNPIEDEWESFMFSEDEYPFVEYGKPALRNIAVTADGILDTANRKMMTTSESTRLSTLAYRDLLPDIVLEEKGVLLPKSCLPSPLNSDMSILRDYILNAQTDEDFMPETYNGSKSTGIPVQAQYCPPSVDSHLLFEGCRQENHYTMRTRLIWKTHFPSQLNARFDTPGFFTEVGNKSPTNDARYWGHQWPDGLGNNFGGNPPNGQIYNDRYYQRLSYNGTNPSVSFSLPSGYYKAALMMSYSHMSTGQLRAIVQGGTNNLLEFETDTPGVWAELNNHPFNCSTPDAFTPAVYRTSIQIRQDQYSMPLKFRRKDGQPMTGNIPVQLIAEDGKDIEYWGLYYTRARRLFIPVLSAMGSHNSEDLAKFFPHGFLKRRPNYIFYDADLVNQFRVAVNAPGDTPTNYADRMVNFAKSFLDETFVKGVLVSFGMWYQNMDINDAATDMPKNYLTSEGNNDGLAYIRKGIKKMGDLKVTYPGKVGICDATQAFQSQIDAIATELGITKRAATWQNNGTTPWAAYSPTMDGTHDSLIGAKQQFRHGMNNFNFY